MNRLTIDPKTVDLAAMIDRGTHMHGHSGPFLVAGIRMGLLALEFLGSPGYFGIRAESDAGSIPPLSCLSDGIQIGSGCTTGKGNLTVTDACRARARFMAERGATVEICLRQEAIDQVRTMGIVAASEKMKTDPLEELFTWKISSSP